MTEEQPLLADEACEDHTVMFLCTNNYHRSRFAEMLFNALAKEANLDWTACSRGLIVRFSPSSADPISIRALEGLAVRRIPIDAPIHFPTQVQDEDFEQADVVIALKETEHRLYLERRFPMWADKVEYWETGGMGFASTSGALADIEVGIRALISRLSQSDARLQLRAQ